MLNRNDKIVAKFLNLSDLLDNTKTCNKVFVAPLSVIH